MKKAVYLLALALGATSMSAEAQKNTFLVYGGLGYSRTIDPIDNLTKSFDIDLGVGYQFNHHWTVGLTGGYGTSRYKPDGASDWALSDAYRFGPFVRYTQPVNKIFAYWLQGEVAGVGGYTGTTGTRTRTTKFSGTEGYIKPGLSIFFCGTWAINFDLGGIGYGTYKDRGAVKSTDAFAFDFGRTINAGVSVNIGGPSKGKKFKKHRNSEEDQDGYEDWKRKRRSNEDE